MKKAIITLAITAVAVGASMGVSPRVKTIMGNDRPRFEKAFDAGLAALTPPQRGTFMTAFRASLWPHGNLSGDDRFKDKELAVKLCADAVDKQACYDALEAVIDSVVRVPEPEE